MERYVGSLRPFNKIFKLPQDPFSNLLLCQAAGVEVRPRKHVASDTGFQVNAVPLSGRHESLASLAPLPSTFHNCPFWHVNTLKKIGAVSGIHMERRLCLPLPLHNILASN